MFLLKRPIFTDVGKPLQKHSVYEPYLTFAPLSTRLCSISDRFYSICCQNIIRRLKDDAKFLFERAHHFLMRSLAIEVELTGCLGGKRPTNLDERGRREKPGVTLEAMADMYSDSRGVAGVTGPPV